MNDDRIRETLRSAELPDEAGARERGWRVVRAAYAERPVSPLPGRSGRRLVLAVAGAAAVLAVALSPAGAKVGDVIRDVTGIGAKTEPALTSLPASGRLLVDSPVGPWVVDDGGAKRLLGDYSQASWSPGGLYVAVAGGRELAAVEPGGTVHWTVDGPSRVQDPRWSPSGFRVAYRSGTSLRVVAGDGTGDHLLARDVARTPVAWKPLSRSRAARAAQQLPVSEVAAYVEASGRIVVANVDTGTVLWSATPAALPDELAWSSDGRLLLAAGTGGLSVYEPGQSTSPVSIGYGVGSSITAAAFLPGTHRIAAIAQVTGAGGHGLSEVVTGRADVKLLLSRRLLARRTRLTNLVPSPDGRWLLVAQPRRDRWLFVSTRGERTRAATNISSQFDPGASGPIAFPHVEGWCCGP